MKKSLIPLVAIAGLMLASCSSAYKTGQTPDDVYFSTSPIEPEIVSRQDRNSDYESYWSQSDDDYLKMKVQKGGRWNDIDDLDYWYGYNSLCNCNSNWSFGNYWGYNPYRNGLTWNVNPWGYSGLQWNYGYSPWGWNTMYYGGYYSGLYYPSYYFPYAVGAKYPTYTNPSRPSSLRGYGNTLYGNSNYGNNRTRSSSSVGNSGSTYRSIFGGNSNSGNSNSGSSYDRPARTFSNGGSSSSGSSSGSSRTSGSSSGSSSSGSSRGGRGG